MLIDFVLLDGKHVAIEHTAIVCVTERQENTLITYKRHSKYEAEIKVNHLYGDVVRTINDKKES